ncbi:unnamed protein product [Heligmosomoides polygyrus]|uniref:G_PROTEIN_RECEP_F1_2 domain-containing protein n=1 Tax=Heligmosomoides polygyrus TaxID=6339 RepID=A0A183FTB8_HELPZ|nr:unnamed protein product [Heligmosomoides polygyrus]
MSSTLAYFCTIINHVEVVLLFVVLFVCDFSVCDRAQVIPFIFQFFLQTVSICTSNLIAALIYVYMQFLTTPPYSVMIEHICWQLGHGTTAFLNNNSLPHFY